MYFLFSACPTRWIIIGLFLLSGGWLSAQDGILERAQHSVEQDVVVYYSVLDADACPAPWTESQPMAEEYAWISERMAMIFIGIGFYDAAEEVLKDTLRIWKKSWGNYYPHYC